MEDDCSLGHGVRLAKTPCTDSFPITTTHLDRYRRTVLAFLAVFLCRAIIYDQSVCGRCLSRPHRSPRIVSVTATQDDSTVDSFGEVPDQDEHLRIDVCVSSRSVATGCVDCTEYCAEFATSHVDGDSDGNWRHVLFVSGTTAVCAGESAVSGREQWKCSGRSCPHDSRGMDGGVGMGRGG